MRPTGSATPVDGRAAWLRLAIALLVAVIGNAGMWSIILILPDVGAEFGISRAAASLPYTATMLGFALGNFLIGKAVDRFGLALCLAAAAIVLGIAYALATLATGIWVLAAVQLVIGFGTAASFGPLIADLSTWFRRRRGLAVAIAASGNYLAGAVWPVLLGGVLANGDWRQAYLVLALACLCAMLPLTWTLRHRLPPGSLQQDDAIAAERVRDIGLSPRALTVLLGVAGIGCCMAMAMPQVHIVALCVDLGYGPAVGANMLALMLMGGCRLAPHLRAAG